MINKQVTVKWNNSEKNGSYNKTLTKYAADAPGVQLIVT